MWAARSAPRPPSLEAPDPGQLPAGLTHAPEIACRRCPARCPDPGRPSSIERLGGESFRSSAGVAGLVSSLLHGAEAPLRGMDPVRSPTRVRGEILLTNREIAGLLAILFAF